MNIEQGQLFPSQHLSPEIVHGQTGAVPKHKSKRDGDIKWSYSRAQTLATCARQYYYQYYASKKTLAKADPNKEELRTLSLLSNRHLRAGNLLHLGIRTFYKRAAESPDADTSTLDSWLLTILEKDRLASLEYLRTGQIPEGQFAPVVLLEYVTHPQTAHDLYCETKDRVSRAFGTFLKSALFEEYRNPDLASQAYIEKRISFALDSLKITGQIDFAYPNGKQLRVIDWKLRPTGIHPHDSLQLLTYALWAAESLSWPVEDIEVVQIPLLDGAPSKATFSSGLLHLARGKISQSVELMRTLDPYGRKSVADAFTTRDEEKICESCRFRTVCWRGRK